MRISLKSDPSSSINNKPAWVQIMDWRWIRDKPLFEPMSAKCTEANMRRSASIKLDTSKFDIECLL